MPDLLVELGTEEMPADAIAPALAAWRKETEAVLAAQRLPAASWRVAATPRRLVLHAAGIPEVQPGTVQEHSGPPKSAAFDAEGRPTRVAEGFARKQGVPVSEIQFRNTARGEYCFAVRRIEGRDAHEILSEVLPAVIARLPFTKSMTWRDPSQRFVRPVRTIAALFGPKVIPFESWGIRSGREVLGHPFLSPGPLSLESAEFDAYRERLRERKVIVDPGERRSIIEGQLEGLLAKYGVGHGQPALLEEVTNLVEWPQAIEGGFSEEFLRVPGEVVEAAMMEHQRYFPVHDRGGRLVNRFIVISNREGDPRGRIRAGNERVLRARLADARFFWEEDRKTRLADRVEGLKSVLYQEKLGSYHDRAGRIAAMAACLGRSQGLPAAELEKLGRAAWLCKADLLTQMVYEFPALQGVMGREYATADGEPTEVAQAIEEHYRPRQAGGNLPESALGTLLALAEKVDTIGACFAAGLAPTASQDPYGLRRQTLGIIRIVLEKKLSLALTPLFQHELALLPESLGARADLLVEIRNFIRDRLYHFSLDAGYRYDLVHAVLAAGFDDLLDFWARLDAVTALSAEPEWPALVEVVERTCKIARGAAIAGEPEEGLLREQPERRVFEVYQRHGAEIEKLFRAGDYRSGARLYHRVFAQTVHDFFDKVFVNVEDAGVRQNRLKLMRAVHRLFADRVANLVQVVLGGQAPPS
ncbi:MAG: glycine--tRNA ligase subunit beta [Planctomycetes bacterium]|nr:glycine--tRNA ligase subunit beta [Planctomycetota bacterium]